MRCARITGYLLGLAAACAITAAWAHDVAAIAADCPSASEEPELFCRCAPGVGTSFYLAWGALLMLPTMLTLGRAAGVLALRLRRFRRIVLGGLAATSASAIAVLTHLVLRLAQSWACGTTPTTAKLVVLAVGPAIVVALVLEHRVRPTATIPDAAALPLRR